MITSVVLQSFCPSGKRIISVTVYVSDLGKIAMQREARYGPEGIWKQEESVDSVDQDSGDENVDDDSNRSRLESDKYMNMYDKILKNNDSDNRYESLGDFVRPPDTHGIVLDSELKRLKTKATSSIDDSALREYEKQRLQYYFAVAVCDDIETASSIYEQLDGKKNIFFLY